MSSYKNSKKCLSLDIKKKNIKIGEADKQGFKDSQYSGHDNSVLKKKRHQIVLRQIKEEEGDMPRSLSNIENQIMLLVADNCTTTIQGIIDTLEIDVCHTTFWRWLKKNNYSWKITKPIPEKKK
ncbi:hypothetical protein RF11_12862 [Thelohanellus kitauei]|uniref:Winged helix-turn helix domain-containing protein n=1 Tax=Thelohanellus kitauei TaxID=669202 RepID=A0A0C2IX31_THEKT|nr:hypothetical protein RF11_12862 [Thelohanellus kitauei]